MCISPSKDDFKSLKGYGNKNDERKAILENAGKYKEQLDTYLKSILIVMLNFSDYCSGNINMSSTIPLITTSEFSCSACQKIFKKQSGLSRHLTIVKKYNIPRNNLDNLSETNNKSFKNILVYLIHCKLQNGFKKGGHQLVSLACTEHQFFDIFKGYIHHCSNKNIYKSIAANCAEGITTKRCKSKYNSGEVTIEWKIKAKKDAKENYCEAGFIYMHFWVKQI
ncbi:hypothetical protein RhiirA4_464175 [Rhizophagus irregularis]|uniref:C2H2-type domain-containing protein n=1 Tax=Rhizophagus irregularis TaxID=588596 RepID=A0A2I1GPH7_9GLOM|nr:hypothetical protein RhiirA4_464175 [Rhizophagus irregularis]